jgi:DUF4097 and DUF4098 domain-containing protein YvlB
MLRTMGGTVLAVALLPGLAARAEQVDQRRPAASDGTVEIENPAGAVKVVGWNKAEVAVTGSLGRHAELTLTGGPRRTHVEVEVEGNPHGTRSDIEVRVPAGSRVSVESFAASIDVSEVTGAVTAETVNGSITVTGATEVSAESVNGSVEVSGPAVRLHASAVNGSVTVRGARGELEADTVNGELHVAGGGPFDRAHLESVSGAVRFEGDLARHGILEAQTVSGEIDLALPASVAADFTVSTFSGSVSNDFGAATYRTGRHSPEKEVTFSTNGGGAKVAVETLSGGITLRKR